MSQNMGQETFADGIRLMDYVESWFDNHPEPWNIEFTQVNENIKIFYADLCYDIWMVQIEFNNARAAAVSSQMLKEMSNKMGITQILIGKELFLFTDTRF